VRTDNLNVTQARIRPETKEKMGQPSYNFHLLVSFNPKILHSFQPTVTARRNGRHLVTFRGVKFCFSLRDNKRAASHCTPSCNFFSFLLSCSQGQYFLKQCKAFPRWSGLNTWSTICCYDILLLISISVFQKNQILCLVMPYITPEQKTRRSCVWVSSL
jgi:hypothetical protein